MGILKIYNINTYDADSYESWAWSRLPRSQRLVYELEMAEDAVNRLIDPDYAAAQRRAVDRREWARGLRNATRTRDYLTSRVMRLIAPTRAVARKQRPARRPGRSARAPASSGDDGDGDGDPESESQQHSASKKPVRFFHRSYPGAPTRDELTHWESVLRSEGFTSETCAPRLTYAPDHYADHYADAGINSDDGDLDADDGDEPWRDPTNPFHTRTASVVADLIDAEDAAAITPAVQARLDHAAKAKAKADADRLRRQRMAVLEACDNPRQRLVFEILCGGATAEEAAQAAGYASATVVTKMITRWKERAGKGQIVAGFEQLDLFGSSV